MRGVKVIEKSFERFSDLIDYLEKMSNREDYNIIDIKSLKKKNL